MFDFFISNAWASEGAQQSSLLSLLPLIILVVVFWFVLIRPQMKRTKEQRIMVESMVAGDEIVTNGGLLGKVKEVGDNFIVLELAADVRVKVQKYAVSTIMPKGTVKTL